MPDTHIPELCILIDVQDAYTRHEDKAVHAIRAQLGELRDVMPVLWVYIDYTRASAPAPATALRLRDTFAKFTPTSGLQPRITPASCDYVMRKDSLSAFTPRTLHPFLQEAGTQRLWLGGFATTACVWATARDAKTLGYDTRLVQDFTDATGFGAVDILAQYGAAGIPPTTSVDMLEEVKAARLARSLALRPDVVAAPAAARRSQPSHP